MNRKIKSRGFDNGEDMNNGYIRLHRKFLEWEWLQNPNDVSLFVHLLLMTNWKDSKYKDIDVPRGSLVTGRKELAKQVGISEQQIRTSLNHLKSTNVITIKSFNKFSIISINNYDKYQIDNQEDNQQVTNNQPASNQQITTSEKRNKVINKKYIKEKINKKEKYGQFENVLLTDDEYQKLKEKFSDYMDRIENLSYYIKSKGDKYKSHYGTILNWARKDSRQMPVPEWFDTDIKKNTNDLDELNSLLEEFK